MNKKNNFEKGRIIVTVLLAMAGILCAVALLADRGADQPSQFATSAAYIAIGCIILVFVVMFTAMRCPYCNRLIIRKCLTVKNCPHCNRNLVSGIKSKKKR